MDRAEVLMLFLLFRIPVGKTWQVFVCFKLLILSKEIHKFILPQDTTANVFHIESAWLKLMTKSMHLIDVFFLKKSNQLEVQKYMPYFPY